MKVILIFTKPTSHWKNAYSFTKYNSGDVFALKVSKISKIVIIFYLLYDLIIIDKEGVKDNSWLQQEWFGIFGQLYSI
jgi:hypothetical protein